MAGLLFGRRARRTSCFIVRLNPLFGGSAFRTSRSIATPVSFCLNPLFGGSAFRTVSQKEIIIKEFVLIPFLAGLLFGPDKQRQQEDAMRLNPLFGGSAFRTLRLLELRPHES